ncbi:hypothetical protein Glove_71g39 [Diversispora epigaea]|uniref:Uncharacterized protein n=1 Tax=Diversispora epigaea TaxID=1348612 RepID=A0A397J9X2_9GLOM|nr:hypothetical protein Glove_71g39 [Diversispora epigaea]
MLCCFDASDNKNNLDSGNKVYNQYGDDENDSESGDNQYDDDEIYLEFDGNEIYTSSIDGVIRFLDSDDDSSSKNKTVITFKNFCTVF